MGPININTDGILDMVMVGVVATAIISIISIFGIIFLLYRGVMSLL